MSSRFEPKTLTATGIRTPVESISIRLAIGWVKLLPQPGICKAVLISSTRSVFVFFQSKSRSANGLSSAARSGGQFVRSRLTRDQLPIPAQLRQLLERRPLVGADGTVEQLPVERLDPLLEPARHARSLR